MLGEEESKIIAFGGNKMSKDTKVSLGNGGKSSVAPAEEMHMGEDCIVIEKVTKVVGPPS